MERFLFALFMIVFATVLFADPVKRIFMLHSYSQEYPWTRSQHQAFVEGFQHQPGFGIDVSTEYLDTKRVSFTPDYEDFFLAYLRQKYGHYRPDIIYVTDDNALTFMMRHRKTLFGDAPVFFSGVNDQTRSSHLVRNHFTGVFETNEIVPNIDLIRQFSPQTRDIWIVGDESSTYAAIERDIKSHLDRFPTMTLHFVSSSQFSDIMVQLPSKERTFVILSTIGEWKDEYGKYMGVRESIDRLRQRPNLVLCSMEDAHIIGGVVGGYVTSGEKQGETASRMALAYLKGKPLGSIPMVTRSPNVYMFDHTALTRSRIVLSEYTARNATVLHKKEGFLDRNRKIVLEVLFIVAVSFMAYLVLSFVLFLEKRSRIHRLRKDIDVLQGEKAKLADLLESVEERFRIGWWEYDVRSGAVSCSDALDDILQTDHEPLDGIESLLLTIHPADHSRIVSIIREASHEPLTQQVRHKIISQTGTVYVVDHYLRSYKNAQDGGMRVLGIVQVQHGS